MMSLTTAGESLRDTGSRVPLMSMAVPSRGPVMETISEQGKRTYCKKKQLSVI